MEAKVKPGKYVLAVSGGVDSIVLLDLLVKQANSKQQTANSSTSSVELVVAHFNHGIRKDSHADEKLVKNAAKSYGLKFEFGRGKLGPNTSEEKARAARYKFLETVKKKYGAKSIITAHHQDDLIETAFINLLRGTGRRGLSAISSNESVVRPLLNTPKTQIISYGKKNALVWHEDTTNKDEEYLRNYVRKNVTPRLTEESKKVLLRNIDKVAEINKVLNKEIATLSQILVVDNSLDRGKFAQLPLPIADEVVMNWLRSNGYKGFDKQTIKRVSLAIKTAMPGTTQVIRNGLKMIISRSRVSLEVSD